jgi:hypothetical protein
MTFIFPTLSHLKFFSILHEGTFIDDDVVNDDVDDDDDAVVLPGHKSFRRTNNNVKELCTVLVYYCDMIM